MKSNLSVTQAERLVVLGMGAAAAFTLIYITLSGEPVRATLQGPFRLLGALAAAVFGGALPGATLQIGLRRGGLALRAAGAAAFFIIVWLAGPSWTGA